jgi:hypothetical protein
VIIYRVRIYRVRIYRLRMYRVRIYRVRIYRVRIYIVRIYKVRIKYFPDYKHLLQENYVEYKHKFFSKCNSTQEVFLQHISFVSIVGLYVCIPLKFIVINVCNQGKTPCSPCSIWLNSS